MAGSKNSWSMMTVNGPAIRLRKYDDSFSLIFPMTEDFTVSSQQNVFQPLKELVSFIQSSVQAVGDNLPGGFGKFISTGTKIVAEVNNILGLQIGGKGFYASAWKGSQPSQTNLKLKFIRGMNGNWAPYDSVVEPANLLYSLTLPSSLGGTSENILLTAPMPSGIEVVGRYATQLISGATFGLANEIPGFGGKEAIRSIGSDKPKVLSQIEQALFSKTWRIDLGYQGDKGFIVHMDLPPAIITTSSIAYSKEMCEQTPELVLPNSATVSLSFIFEDILTSSNMSTATTAVESARVPVQTNIKAISVDALTGPDVSLDIRKFEAGAK